MIGSVSVFTVQINDTSDETNVSATASVKSRGHGHIGPLKQKHQGAPSPPGSFVGLHLQVTIVFYSTIVFIHKLVWDTAVIRIRIFTILGLITLRF